MDSFRTVEQICKLLQPESLHECAPRCHNKRNTLWYNGTPSDGSFYGGYKIEGRFQTFVFDKLFGNPGDLKVKGRGGGGSRGKS